MNIVIIRAFVCSIFLYSCIIQGQDSLKTVIAKDGDGIFSVLKREGIIGDKYYVEFVELNKDKINNGTVLQIGETYKIPNAPDSFKNMGRKIVLSKGIDFPIFTEDIRSLKREGKVLKNTIYYLIFDEFDGDNLKLIKSKTQTNDAIAKAIAKELMQQGARVFLFEYNSNETPSLGDYVDAINKRYLKYAGQHQRLLFVNLNQEALGQDTSVSVSHYEKSKEGAQFAKSLEKMFYAKNVKLISSEKNVFTDNVNLYLAKNAMPTMTYVSLVTKDIDNKDFVNKITKGIKNDYSKLSFDE